MDCPNHKILKETVTQDFLACGSLGRPSNDLHVTIGFALGAGRHWTTAIATFGNEVGVNLEQIPVMELRTNDDNFHSLRHTKFLESFLHVQGLPVGTSFVDSGSVVWVGNAMGSGEVI